MACLLDTNIFLRLVPKSDPERRTVLEALQTLTEKKEVLCYTSQVLAEFWAVCTRPATARGGYGLSPAQTEKKARLIERYCRLLTDSIATHQEWRRLVAVHSVMGAEVHDARLPASMFVHGITHLITMDKDDFSRYKGITVLEPHEIVSP